MFGLGIPELILIFVIALIVFGPKKLPDLGKSIGRGIAEFRRASMEVKESIESEMREVEKSVDISKIEAAQQEMHEKEGQPEQKGLEGHGEQG